MKKIYCINCSKCNNEDGTNIKEDEPIEILKILGLIQNTYSLKIWLKKNKVQVLDQKIQIKQEITSLKKQGEMD